LLFWPSLKRWDYNIFDLAKVTGGTPLLLIGWAVLGSPHSQLSDVTLDEFKGYDLIDFEVKNAFAKAS
jgi:hypothetical protein